MLDKLTNYPEYVVFQHKFCNVSITNSNHMTSWPRAIQQILYQYVCYFLTNQTSRGENIIYSPLKDVIYNTQTETEILDFLNCLILQNISDLNFLIQGGTFLLRCCTDGTTSAVHIVIAIGCYLFASKRTAEPKIKVKIPLMILYFKLPRVK